MVKINFTKDAYTDIDESQSISLKILQNTRNLLLTKY